MNIPSQWLGTIISDGAFVTGGGRGADSSALSFQRGLEAGRRETRRLVAQQGASNSRDIPTYLPA